MTRKRRKNNAGTSIGAKAAKPKPRGKTTGFNRKKGVKPVDQQSQRNFSSVKMKLKTLLLPEYQEPEMVNHPSYAHALNKVQEAASTSSVRYWNNKLAG